MTTKDLLIAAKALIAAPDNWCQGFGSIKNGDHVSFCMAGAVNRASVDASITATSAALETLAEAMHSINSKFHSIVGFNDHKETTHEQVMAVFDKAIAEN